MNHAVQRMALVDGELREHAGFVLDLPWRHPGELLDLSDHVRLIIKTAPDRLIERHIVRKWRHGSAERAIRMVT